MSSSSRCRGKAKVDIPTLIDEEDEDVEEIRPSSDEKEGEEIKVLEDDPVSDPDNDEKDHSLIDFVCTMMSIVMVNSNET